MLQIAIILPITEYKTWINEVVVGIYQFEASCANSCPFLNLNVYYVCIVKIEVYKLYIILNYSLYRIETIATTIMV